jgi:hypothetical protein
MILGVIISMRYLLRPCSARMMRVKNIQKYKRSDGSPCKDDELKKLIPREFRYS